MRGALLVAGTSSDVGKSMIAAGLCRWLARQGVRVAPFTALNMSLNSFVTPDGAEIGRSQAMQAAAAGIEPTADLNPVLLKPGGDGRTRVVLRGRPLTEVDPSATVRSPPGCSAMRWTARAGCRAAANACAASVPCPVDQAWRESGQC